MARRDRSWRYALGWWAGLAGVTAVLVVIGVALRGAGGLQTAANVAQLVGVVLVVPTLLVPLWLWWRRSTARPPVTSAHVAHAKDVLAGLVEEQWTVEATLRSLDDPAPIPVRWRLTTTEQVMDQPANLTPSLRRLAVSSDAIGAAVARFRRMRRRRLVILGGPGTGKTTLAVQLIRELLATRAVHPGEPVPVLLPVAGWDTTAYPRLQQWLAVRLAQDYPALRAAELPAGMAEVLAVRGHILPVLDGLDELPPPAQQAVITALNQSLGDTDQLIVTSRTAEFGRAVAGAGDVLTSAMVIEPEPLTPKTAAAYLKRCLPPRPPSAWPDVLAVLRATSARPDPHDPGAVLAAVAGTALGLWLLRVVYVDGRADPAPLLEPGRFSDAGGLRGHLFDRLIPALIAARPPGADPFRPRRRHDPGQARRWLTGLAHTMSHPLDGAPTRDFAWWRLARRSGAFTAATRRGFGIAGLVAGGLVGWVMFELVGVLVGGLGVGRALWALSESWPMKEPGFADLRLRGRGVLLVRKIPRGLTFGLVAGLTDGLVSGLLDRQLSEFVSGFVSGFVVVFLGGLVGGVMQWVEAPAAERATAPMTGWRADRVLNIVRTGVGLLGGGLAAAFIGMRGAELVAGLVGGSVAGLMVGNHQAWPAYLVATYRLARIGRLPWALMPFLDDMHRLGLLRAVGPIYQFRHADFQDHLAADPPDADRAPSHDGRDVVRQRAGPVEGADQE
ncbi:hypothetical protein Sru01_50660 [Sphaerisporangium rufum]|uniref:NACHT domain-containing protein n=1 Tax=Sphaerisporangium rufum TaxID=1381558 RepID=A0A919V1U1_9ACTN|nr:NACHT domain-containing protein [Sphaerisporangium rufum]GII80084.1 hypothetical protein Sru01_50660 [Sphaerisporangium rufum]